MKFATTLLTTAVAFSALAFAQESAPAEPSASATMSGATPAPSGAPTCPLEVQTQCEATIKPIVDKCEAIPPTDPIAKLQCGCNEILPPTKQCLDACGLPELVAQFEALSAACAQLGGAAGNSTTLPGNSTATAGGNAATRSAAATGTATGTAQAKSGELAVKSTGVASLLGVLSLTGFFALLL
ncbi:hypothetical protein HDV05_007494 [Chytridiales sp. JEL 0842]|nr:hypothetical protein HDV05_007494 [Chytridiales sp. JEL 0842]